MLGPKQMLKCRRWRRWGWVEIRWGDLGLKSRKGRALTRQKINKAVDKMWVNEILESRPLPNTLLEMECSNETTCDLSPVFLGPTLAHPISCLYWSNPGPRLDPDPDPDPGFKLHSVARKWSECVQLHQSYSHLCLACEKWFSLKDKQIWKIWAKVKANI